MRTPVLVLLTSAVLLLALGAGSALADTPAVQSADQSAKTGQSASSSANAEQIDPSNSVVDIRIGSPGDNGAIEQSNSNSATSAAGNRAGTTQGASQASAGSGVQSAAQLAATAQRASSAAKAVQVDPANEAVSIRIHSDGKDGPVSQSNDNSAASRAGSTAGTKQGVDQASGGGSGGGGGVQDAQQSASTDQSAKSGAGAEQDHPSNEVVRIRIHSPGGNGDVKQSNSNSADSSAANQAFTGQGAAQTQGGGGGTQYVGQDATTAQSAASAADAEQRHPSNSVESIRLHSPGDDGSISQSNDNQATSAAGNTAKTGQSVLQDIGGSGSGHGVQASDQTAATGQLAESQAKARQDGASNSAGGVRIDSAGNGGSVEQSNSNAAQSKAGNAAETLQFVGQSQDATGGALRSDCSCSAGKDGKAVQAAGQSASTKQGAKSGAAALQSGASNLADGVRKGSKGEDGAVLQSNDNAADSSAANTSGTQQSLQQAIGAAFGKLAVQAAGQDAGTLQGAASGALALQGAPGNATDPIRLDSTGGHGSSGQSNDNTGASRAGSTGATLQELLQLL